MEDKKFEGLREKLSQLDWPSFYMFKFIVPRNKEDEIFNILNNEDVGTKLSRNGKYISITSCKYMSSEDEVINIYAQAAKVEGVISL
ncbi:MAG: DUF493 family protein [Cytophagaceae bacterium]